MFLDFENSEKDKIYDVSCGSLNQFVSDYDVIFLIKFFDLNYDYASLFWEEIKDPLGL